MPHYLARTFLERGDGFHFSAPAPAGIGDRRHLKSSDPWEVLACALLNLQQGQFDVAPIAIELMKRADDVNVWIACAHLLGFAAPGRIVDSLFGQFSATADEPRRRYLCSAAVDAGRLWAAEQMLAIYPTADPDEQRYFHFELSWLLEEKPGRLEEGPEVTEIREADYEAPEEKVDLEGYVKIAEKRVASLMLDHEIAVSRGHAIAEGGPVNIKEMADTLLARLKQGDRNYRIDRGRMLLEAATGFDCQGFFNEHFILQRLAASAIVEEMIESVDFTKYEPGVRYFFGHRIPD